MDSQLTVEFGYTDYDYARLDQRRNQKGDRAKLNERNEAHGTEASVRNASDVLFFGGRGKLPRRHPSDDIHRFGTG